ncbi:MAG: amidohydrolase family protein, partial [Phycisphaerae bacterium]|nr:amidohydrolase family protein [Phycisphaerae bacterium]
LGYIADGHARGDKGMKIGAVPPYAKPDIKAARKAYVDALRGGPVADVLQWTVIEALLEKAAEWDWPVPVHCGVWLDYRRRDPKHAIDMIMKHPGVRFDLYHLGAPFVRDCIFIAKNFPNAYLNLCWCYLLSEEMTRRAIGEILDTVPINKVFAFGGDEVLAVENVYGHLVMAREVLAEALAQRIAQGQMDMDGAKQVARMWLYENPARFYGLDA